MARLRAAGIYALAPTAAGCGVLFGTIAVLLVRAITVDMGSSDLSEICAVALRGEGRSTRHGEATRPLRTPRGIGPEDAFCLVAANDAGWLPSTDTTVMATPAITTHQISSDYAGDVT